LFLKAAINSFKTELLLKAFEAMTLMNNLEFSGDVFLIVNHICLCGK
jgi:hypothetical protein